MPIAMWVFTAKPQPELELTPTPTPGLLMTPGREYMWIAGVGGGHTSAARGKAPGNSWWTPTTAPLEWWASFGLCTDTGQAGPSLCLARQVPMAASSGMACRVPTHSTCFGLAFRAPELPPAPPFRSQTAHIGDNVNRQHQRGRNREAFQLYGLRKWLGQIKFDVTVLESLLLLPVVEARQQR
mmetsp:Transcript_15078/g.26752  ORF Transcript_15078/g.26752 Transcript_15078/m.26752 type:complete len:183 (+) Transcript_15078:251-799(+)